MDIRCLFERLVLLNGPSAFYRLDRACRDCLQGRWLGFFRKFQQFFVRQGSDDPSPSRYWREAKHLIELKSAGVIERVGRRHHPLRIEQPDRVERLEKKPLANPEA